MLDPVTYRIRIGSFQHGMRSRRIRKQYPMYHKFHRFGDSEYKSFQREDNEGKGSKNVCIRWKTTIFFLVAIASVVLTNDVYTSRDGRAAKNRQRRPTFQPFTYTSDEEKDLFNNVRSLEDKQARVSSHLKFLTDCSSSNVYPVNLVYNGNFNVALPNADILNELRDIDHRNSK